MEPFRRPAPELDTNRHQYPYAVQFREIMGTHEVLPFFDKSVLQADLTTAAKRSRSALTAEVAKQTIKLCTCLGAYRDPSMVGPCDRPLH